jgi:hypothetical protein
LLVVATIHCYKAAAIPTLVMELKDCAKEVRTPLLLGGDVCECIQGECSGMHQHGPFQIVFHPNPS